MHTQNKQNRRRGEHSPTQLHKPEPKLDEEAEDRNLEPVSLISM